MIKVGDILKIQVCITKIIYSESGVHYEVRPVDQAKRIGNAMTIEPRDVLSEGACCAGD